MLVLGVEDDRRVVGVADADATMRLVDTVSYQNVEPPLLCLQETVMIGDSTVLVVRVPKGPERPYRTNRGVYYVRTSSGRRQATREELMRLYHTALAIFPDELPVRGTGVRHLNVGYFEEFFRRHYGLAEEQITGAQSSLDLHLRTGASIRGFRREDRPEIPAEVLREAVVNAVAHRDYSLLGQVRLFVFADRVEIISPGSLPNTVTLDNIRFGIHMERNPILVTFLAKMGLLSQVGTGIPRMIRAMRDRGLPEPSFALLGDHFRVTIARPVAGSGSEVS